MTTYDPKLDPEFRNRIHIDELCEQFEELWRDGDQISVFEFAAKHPPELFERLVRELMTVEQRLIGEKRAQEVAEKFSFEDPKLTKSGVESTAKFHAGMPERIGPYITKYRLGSGSAGEVYAAIDSDSQKWVAIKVPHSFLATNEEGTRRFLREARNAERLIHPNIVRFLHVGRVETGPYLVYELLNGLDLGSYLKQGYELTEMQIAQLISDACRALQYAHDQGIVHRDLKPSNLMVLLEEPTLSAEGQLRDSARLPLTGRLTIKILDFGIARLLEAGTVLTVEGDILGTPAYMSPEQASGQSNTSDHRSDIYGIGVVLYELLTGSTPFRGTATDVIDRIRREEVPQLSETHPHLSKALSTICNRCLRLAPSRRYTRIVDVADDLDRYLNGQTILAKPVGWVESSISGWKRHQLSRIAIAFAVATVLCFGVFALIPSKPDTAALLRTPLQKWIASLPQSLNNVEQLVELIPSASVSDLVELANVGSPHGEKLFSILDAIQIANPNASSNALQLLLASRFPDRAKELLKRGELTRWISDKVNDENAKYWVELVEPFRETFRSQLRDDYNADLKNVHLGRCKLLALCYGEDLDSLTEFLAKSKLTELDIWTEAIRAHRDFGMDRLSVDWTPYEQPANFINISESSCIEDSNRILAKYLLGDSESFTEALKARPDPRVCTYTMHRFADANRNIEPILKAMRNETRSDVLYGLMVIVALSETQTVKSAEFADCKQWLLNQYSNHPDAGVHGMCRHLAKVWKLDVETAEADLNLREPRPSGDKGWFVDAEGTHYAIIRGPNQFWMGWLEQDKLYVSLSTPYPRGDTRIESTYAISMDRISVSWIPVSEARQKSRMGGPTFRSWYDIHDYCNSRNAQAGFEQLKIDESYKDYDSRSGDPPEVRSFVGYRMPTNAEWEYASRAGTVTHRFHGTLLTDYAEYYLKQKQNPKSLMLPNRLGLVGVFDLVDFTISCHFQASPLMMVCRGGDETVMDNARSNCGASMRLPHGYANLVGARLVIALP